MHQKAYYFEMKKKSKKFLGGGIANSEECYMTGLFLVDCSLQ